MTGAPALRGAYLGVLALRWVPTGLLLPVTVLLMTGRGLGLAEVGLVVGVQGLVVLVLEVPTGGLADVVGARRVLVASSLLALAATALLLVADGLEGFLLAWAVMGVHRALDSGPLEAWYVDAAVAADPERDLERDLASAGVVTYGALASGALLASAVALLPPVAGSTVGAAVTTAALLEVAHLSAVLVLVRDGRPAGGVRTVLRQARGTGRAVLAGARLARASRPLRLVLLVELGWGAGLAGVELLWQPRTVELIGRADAAATTGLVSAAGLACGAAGAALLPLLLRLLGGRLALAAAVQLAAQAVAVLVLARAGLVGLVVGYVGFYALHGSLNAAHSALLHRRTPSGQRATVLSLNSLVSRAGALPAGLALGALADASPEWAFAATAGLLLLAAPLYLWSGEEHAAQARTVCPSVPGPAGRMISETGGRPGSGPHDRTKGST